MITEARYAAGKVVDRVARARLAYSACIQHGVQCMYACILYAHVVSGSQLVTVHASL